jgi:hypothetical protein
MSFRKRCPKYTRQCFWSCFERGSVSTMVLLWHFQYSLLVCCFVKCLGACFLRKSRRYKWGNIRFGWLHSVWCNAVSEDLLQCCCLGHLAHCVEFSDRLSWCFSKDHNYIIWIDLLQRCHPGHLAHCVEFSDRLSWCFSKDHNYIIWIDFLQHCHPGYLAHCVKFSDRLSWCFSKDHNYIIWIDLLQHCHPGHLAHSVCHCVKFGDRLSWSFSMDHNYIIWIDLFKNSLFFKE